MNIAPLDEYQLLQARIVGLERRIEELRIRMDAIWYRLSDEDRAALEGTHANP